MVLLTVGVPLLLMFGCIFNGCKKEKTAEKTAKDDTVTWRKFRMICEKGVDKKSTEELIEKEFCKKKNNKECNKKRMELVDETATTVNTLLKKTKTIRCKDKEKLLEQLHLAAHLLRSRRRTRKCFERNEHAFAKVKPTSVLEKQFKELKKLAQDKDVKEAIGMMGEGALKKEILEYMKLASEKNIDRFVKLSFPPIQNEATSSHFMETHEIMEETKEHKRSKPVHLAFE